MLPLSLLLALTSAQAVDLNLSDYPNLQAALDDVAGNDVLIIDSFVAGQGVVTKVQNAPFTIRGVSPCASGVGCAWGWGNGTTVQIAAAGGVGAVTIEDLAIAGPGDAPGLVITDKNAVVRNVLFTEFNTTNPGPNEGSAFTFIGGADHNVLIENITVDSNYGSAVYIFGADAEIYDSTFNNNGNEYVIGGNFFFLGVQDNFYGAGLHFNGDEIALGMAELDDPNDPNSDIIKRGNTFTNNTAIYGGGAYIQANQGSIEANSFEYNVANNFDSYNDAIELNGLGAGVAFNGEGLGGGLFVGPSGIDGPLNVRWNSIASNWAWDGAGVHFEDPEDVHFENNLVAQNWAVHVAGGLSVIHDDNGSDARPSFVNNTFVGNIAGLTRVLRTVQVVGGGGNARIEGLIPEFKNNVVSHASYGGGILGVVGEGPFEPGDDFNTWFRNNLFYWNCDINLCAPAGPGDLALTGNYAQYALHPSNQVDVEPSYIYFGDPREPSVVSDNDAYPDVYCLNAFSAGIAAGDSDFPNLGDPSYGSDVGHCGGLECFFFNRDRDEDGWLQQQDCLDDPNAVFPGRPAPEDINPAAEEVCDYEDNDCDGVIDEGFVNKWYPDLDGDGAGDATNPGILACDKADLPGPNYIDNADDCDDENPLVSGSISEICDGIDNDCDGIVNEAEDIAAGFLYADVDGDGFGTKGGQPKFVCESIATGEFYDATEVGAETIDENLPAYAYRFFELNLDCNDGDPSFNPDAPEVCDERDHNCNDDPYDVGSGADKYYLDTDGDNWGDLSTVIALCEGRDLPTDVEGAYVPNGGDCDETNPAINNGADEICDGLDNDCNLIVDDDPVDGVLKYEDFDNDGFGNPATALRACSGSHASTYTATVGGDCDDNDPTVGECSECGCQATPTPGSLGVLTAGLLALFGLRRRR